MASNDKIYTRNQWESVTRPTQMTIDDNIWQLNLSLTERNEVMLTHELATDVTFQVSASTQG